MRQPQPSAPVMVGQFLTIMKTPHHQAQPRGITASIQRSVSGHLGQCRRPGLIGRNVASSNQQRRMRITGTSMHGQLPAQAKPVTRHGK